MYKLTFEQIVRIIKIALRIRKFFPNIDEEDLVKLAKKQIEEELNIPFSRNVN